MEQKQQTPETTKTQLFSGFFLVFWAILALAFIYALVGVVTGNADAMGIGSGWGMLLFCAGLALFVLGTNFFNKEARRGRGLPPFKF